MSRLRQRSMRPFSFEVKQKDIGQYAQGFELNGTHSYFLQLSGWLSTSANPPREVPDAQGPLGSNSDAYVFSICRSRC
jgi:hypothetical protein